MVVLEFYCLFFRTSWGVGVLNSAIFNSFHSRVDFGTILGGCSEFRGRGFEPHKPPTRYATEAGVCPRNVTLLARSHFHFPSKLYIPEYSRGTQCVCFNTRHFKYLRDTYTHVHCRNKIKEKDLLSMSEVPTYKIDHTLSSTFSSATYLTNNAGWKTQNGEQS